jgi:hypothetical protein
MQPQSQKHTDSLPSTQSDEKHVDSKPCLHEFVALHPLTPIVALPHSVRSTPPSGTGHVPQTVGAGVGAGDGSRLGSAVGSRVGSAVGSDVGQAKPASPQVEFTK